MKVMKVAISKITDNYAPGPNVGTFAPRFPKVDFWAPIRNGGNFSV